ncbi:hypothetical protein [Vannielia litorea]|uniref:hypothetical protein n=1 Tax=Vannielia litorea TaxID=1217970 RepID=UPI0009411FC0|nr:hypothetical protein [Vannielia litorea]
MLVLIGLGFISNTPDGAGGTTCHQLTDNIELNRALCRMNPARLWNTPVADLIPGLRAEGAAAKNEAATN